jgi:hypothetical protein
MRHIFLLLFISFFGSLASARPPFACGIYTLYGHLRQARDGFFYLSTAEKTSALFEIRVAGIPKASAKPSFLGIRFYNPQVIESSVSNNTVVFVSLEKGEARELNQSENKNKEVLASYQWPRLVAAEACKQGKKYLDKVDLP